MSEAIECRWENKFDQAYGTISFYLANQDEIDEYLCQGDAVFERLGQEWRAKHPLLRQKLAAYKQQKREMASCGSRRSDHSSLPYFNKFFERLRLGWMRSPATSFYQVHTWALCSLCLEGIVQTFLSR